MFLRDVLDYTICSKEKCKSDAIMNDPSFFHEFRKEKMIMNEEDQNKWYHPNPPTNHKFPLEFGIIYGIP